MENNIIIRNIKIEDIPSVVNIRIDGWKIAYKDILDEKFLQSLNTEEDIERRKKDYKQGYFIVAVKNDEIVGFCRYTDEIDKKENIDCDCEIKAIYVKTELKRQGIGKTMLNYAKNDLKKNGNKNMIIWCLKDNLPSRKFYKSMGGVVIGEKKVNIGEKEYLETGFKYVL